MNTKINIFIKMVNKLTKQEFLFAQSSILIGDVYMYNPVNMWITLTDTDQVTFVYFFMVTIN